MNLRLKLLDKSEIPLFNRSEEEAFSVHDKYFSDGIEPGAEYDDREEHDLNTIIEDPMFTVLAIYDGDTFVGGAIVEDKGDFEKDISISSLLSNTRARALGKQHLTWWKHIFPMPGCLG